MNKDYAQIFLSEEDAISTKMKHEAKVGGKQENFNWNEGRERNDLHNKWSIEAETNKKEIEIIM